LNKKIIELNKSIFHNSDKPRPKINMMTKNPSYKQIIISISNDNANKFMLASSEHIADFNYTLRSTKSDLTIDFICIYHQSLIITSNRVMFLSEISIVSNYVKNCNNIDTNDIQDVWLPQLKSYLRILGIPYIIEGTNVLINSEVIEMFIKVTKATHIFDNINIMSKPCIIKVSLKSNIAIVRIDIWDSQSGSTAKKLINCCFNISSFVATIHGANINSSVSQYKNYWK